MGSSYKKIGVVWIPAGIKHCYRDVSGACFVVCEDTFWLLEVVLLLLGIGNEQEESKDRRLENIKLTFFVKVSSIRRSRLCNQVLVEPIRRRL